MIKLSNQMPKEKNASTQNGNLHFLPRSLVSVFHFGLPYIKKVHIQSNHRVGPVDICMQT